MLENPQAIVARLRELQRQIRDAIVATRTSTAALHAATRQSAADTIYRLDLFVEPVIEAFCERWGESTPLVLVAEGIEPESGRGVPRGAGGGGGGGRGLVDPGGGGRGGKDEQGAGWGLGGG